MSSTPASWGEPASLDKPASLDEPASWPSPPPSASTRPASTPASSPTLASGSREAPASFESVATVSIGQGREGGIARVVPGLRWQTFLRWVFLMRLGRKDERTTNEPKGRDEQELGSFHQKRLSTSKPVLCRPTTGTTNSACEELALRLRHQSAPAITSPVTPTPNETSASKE